MHSNATSKNKSLLKFWGVPPKNHTLFPQQIAVLGSPTNRVKMKPRDADLRFGNRRIFRVEISPTIITGHYTSTNFMHKKHKGNPSKLSGRRLFHPSLNSRLWVSVWWPQNEMGTMKEQPSVPRICADSVCWQSLLARLMSLKAIYLDKNIPKTSGNLNYDRTVVYIRVSYLAIHR